MARKRGKGLLLLGAGAFLLGSGGRAYARTPAKVVVGKLDWPPDPEPDPDDPADDDPDEPPEVPTDPISDPPPPPAMSLGEVYGSLVTPDPTVGRGYRIVQGDKLFGADGIIARALKDAYGRIATAAERTAYYQALTRVRANWVLYATDEPPGIQRVSVQGSQGQLVYGSVTAALLPVNDPWPESTVQSALPRRLIKFARQMQGNNRVVVPVADWQNLAHGVRTYGTLMLPPLSCVGLGPGALANPQCDWPAQLWGAAGVAQGAWSP